MQYQDSFPVPAWVRNIICIAACLSVLALIYTAYSGQQLPWPLVFVVGGFVSTVTYSAFRRW